MPGFATPYSMTLANANVSPWRAQLTPAAGARAGRRGARGRDDSFAKAGQAMNALRSACKSSAVGNHCTSPLEAFAGGLTAVSRPRWITLVQQPGTANS